VKYLIASLASAHYLPVPTRFSRSGHKKCVQILPKLSSECTVAPHTLTPPPVKNYELGPGVLVHACNLSYTGGRDRRLSMLLLPAWAKYNNLSKTN
jgi:hypothetical protein